ncbi:MAG TPA: cbb3-type cytochrome c oxidase subunit I, partial [Bacteroidia bacterium]|nr:cbb3-type cytochrome c oxidase subunit I [Bacteroidia bacterium]
MEVKQTADVAVEHHDDHTHEHDHHETFLTKYIFSQDHKTIAKQYLITAIIMAFFGMYMSLIFRLQLGFPETKFAFLESLIGKWGKGGRLDPGFYMALVTIHGTIMVFFVLTGGLSGTFSNLLIPLQVGARDMASGFLNMLSFWFFFLSCAVMTYSVYIETGPAAGGWTVYPPLSALPQAMPGSGLGMTLWLVSMVFFIIQSLLGGINYICTVINLRTKGMSMTRLPLTVWAFFITAILGVLTFPVLFAAALLLVFDRSFGTSFYLSDIFIGGVALPQSGGSPVLYEHLFWFLGHPEVYIIIL